ncbi:MAG: long-chain fatty acid--CoA ligase [Mariprofundales bacterium]
MKNEHGKQANSLSDLLFSIPDSWKNHMLLQYRSTDNQWHSLTFAQVQQSVLRLAVWLEGQGITAGDRVGLLARNSPAWCIADFAILRLGAVTVPAYTTDPAATIIHQMRDAGCSLIIVDAGEQQRKVCAMDDIPMLTTSTDGCHLSVASIIADARWDGAPTLPPPDRSMLATLIYTSGTTGNSKGVMLTHGNILADVAAGCAAVTVTPDDRMLSFLPLSHAFERTIGQFLAIACGCQIAYAEGVTTLKRDMVTAQPTIMITVPRLLEKIHTGVRHKLANQPAIVRTLFASAQRLGWLHSQQQLPAQWWPWWWLLDRITQRPIRNKMGCKLRLLVCGGAALDPVTGQFITAAGLPLLPGYGLSECAPVVSVNRPNAVDLSSVGPLLDGVEIRFGDNNELYIRGAMVMQGYWKQPQATASVLDGEGWLHSGDLAQLDDKQHLHIIGRSKALIVLSNGENVAPEKIETMLLRDPCIEQVMLVGEGKPWLMALIVTNHDQLMQQNANFDDLQGWMLHRITQSVGNATPHYEIIRGCLLLTKPWNQQSGLVTATQKLKRHAIMTRYHKEIEALYQAE